jgi:5-methylcytosine-specific restriction endonuclease McrA
MVKRRTTVRDRHRAIIRRGEPPCHLCGNPIDYSIRDHLDPGYFTVDHVTPINRGGSDTLDNCAPAHRKCNRDKSDRLPGEQPRKRYAPDQPPAPPPARVTFVTHRVW